MSNCIADPELCIGQHDDKRFRFNVVDQWGDPENISGATEIEFAIMPNVRSNALLTKTLTAGEIQIGVNTQCYLNITDTESGALPPGRLYWELRITSSTGAKQTVAAGPFHVQDTRIEEL